MVHLQGFVWLLLLGSLTAIAANSDNECPSTNATFKWLPDSKHPCTVERITESEFLRRFGPHGLPPLFPTPLVVVPDSEGDRNKEFRDLTERSRILDNFPDNYMVTMSSSNSFSEHRKTIPFSEYLESLDIETLPDKLSNETWYFFGETFSDDWKQLLQHYDIPNCQACGRDMVALSFGIGSRGSGVQWHVHGPGFAETLWGRKHWVLQKEQPNFHPDQTSRNWMEHTYTALGEKERPLECTLSPGDILYFPDMWYHAIVNLDPYTVFVSTFTQEHLFVEG